MFTCNNGNPNYHTFGNNLNVEYTIGYTEKDEDIKDDFSNLKEIKVKDLEDLISVYVKLRMLNKYNIQCYIYIGDKKTNTHIFEDNTCFGLETIKLVKDSNREYKLQQTIKEQEDQLNIYKEFINKYNAGKTFEEFEKAERIERLKKSS